MNVYAFYDPIGGTPSVDYIKLIDIWKKSWIYYGWNPIILNLNNINKNEYYYKYYKKCLELNKNSFEMICFLRWLAIAEIGGWYTDLDMINYGFYPPEKSVYENKVVTCSKYPAMCPFTIYMTKEKYKDVILDSILNYNLSDTDILDINGITQPYTSDMMIINKTCYSKVDICLSTQEDYNVGTDYKNSTVVHYTTPCMNFFPNNSEKTRTQIILEDIRSAKFINN